MNRKLSVTLLSITIVGFGCDKLIGTQVDAGGVALPSIELFVPATARRPGATMPIQVSVALPAAGQANALTETCVALVGAPGVVRPIFPRACADGATSTNETGDGGTLDGAQTCLDLQTKNQIASGSTLAAYTPVGNETTVTLFGGVFANASCSGPPVATVAVVIDLSTPSPDAAADVSNVGSADAQSADVGNAADSGIDVGIDGGADADASTDMGAGQ